MSLSHHFINVKILSLLAALLVVPMASHAESPEVAAVKLDDTAGPGNDARGHVYPNWQATSRQAVRALIPPPPPGPYMSLALNDSSGNKSPFFQAPVESVNRSNPSAVPMQALSPDAPWPENLRKSKRWVPENGYRYVPLQPRSTMKPYHEAQFNSLPNYNQGYRRNTTMNTPGPRWTPSTGVAYGTPYHYVSPGRTGQVKPVSRTPYPATGQP